MKLKHTPFEGHDKKGRSVKEKKTAEKLNVSTTKQKAYNCLLLKSSNQADLLCLNHNLHLAGLHHFN